MSAGTRLDIEEPLRHLRGLSGALYSLAGTAEGSSTKPETLEVLGATASYIHIAISAAIANLEAETKRLKSEGETPS